MEMSFERVLQETDPKLVEASEPYEMCEDFDKKEEEAQKAKAKEEG